MALNITPMMADLDAVRKAFGSRDEALLAEMLENSDLPDDDTDPDEYEVEEDDADDPDIPEELPSSQDALRHIIMGEPWARGIAGKYGFAFMALCEHLGEKLDFAQWGRTRSSYVRAFDQVLTKLGVKTDVVCMATLTEGGGNFPFPRAIAPTFGTMTAAKAAQAAAVLDGVDRDALEAASLGVTISRGDVEPEFVIACFVELRGWCRSAATAGKGLIVFFG